MTEHKLNLSRLAERWSRIASGLGLRIVVPFSIDLASGARIDADVLLMDFGALRGMLLVTDDNKVWKHHREIIDAGYGYSVLSEPTEPLLLSSGIPEDVLDVLRDWGWAGKTAEKPAWLGES